MNNKIVWLILVLIGGIVMSCKEESKLAIKQNDLVPILADIHTAEAIAQPLDRKMKDSMVDFYYEQILEIHQVKKDDFDRTMEVLRKDPILTKKVYAEVVEYLKENTNQK